MYRNYSNKINTLQVKERNISVNDFTTKFEIILQKNNLTNKNLIQLYNDATTLGLDISLDILSTKANASDLFFYILKHKINNNTKFTKEYLDLVSTKINQFLTNENDLADILECKNLPIELINIIMNSDFFKSIDNTQYIPSIINNMKINNITDLNKVEIENLLNSILLNPKYQNIEILKAIAQHPFLNEELLLNLMRISNYHQDIIEILATKSNLSYEFTVDLIIMANDKHKVMDQIMNNIYAKESMLSAVAIFCQANVDYQKQILEHLSAGEEVFKTLVCLPNPNESILKLIAKKPNISFELAKELVCKSNLNNDIIASLIKNKPEYSLQLVNYILSFERIDLETYYTISKIKNLPLTTIDTILDSSNHSPEIIIQIIRNNKIPSDILKDCLQNLFNNRYLDKLVYFLNDINKDVKELLRVTKCSPFLVNIIINKIYTNEIDFNKIDKSTHLNIMNCLAKNNLSIYNKRTYKYFTTLLETYKYDTEVNDLFIKNDFEPFFINKKEYKNFVRNKLIPNIIKNKQMNKNKIFDLMASYDTNNYIKQELFIYLIEKNKFDLMDPVLYAYIINKAEKEEIKLDNAILDKVLENIELPIFVKLKYINNLENNGINEFDLQYNDKINRFGI